MYFVLLKGTHLEKETAHHVEMEIVEGKRRIKSQPVVESERDLVVAFGPDKFREISKDEADHMLKTAGKQGKTNPAPAELVADEFKKAAKAGAIGIAEPPGVDVTGKFEELSEWPKITAYFKRGKGYFITDNSDIVTKEPLKRDEVVKWVQAYMEG